MNGARVSWAAVRLVVFDVDGTLYDQKAMRLRMLRELAGSTMRNASLTTLRVLFIYRRLREAISANEVEGFGEVLVGRTAEETGVGAQTVRDILTEWIDRRPLAHIRAFRYPYLAELFAALKRHRKTMGVFSDYPAVDKLRALELPADHVVAAGDPNVGILKPHPRGLEVLMKAAGVGSGETILIGDRPERDGEAAWRAGAAALIRSDKPHSGWPGFSRFSDPVFAPLFGQ